MTTIDIVAMLVGTGAPTFLWLVLLVGMGARVADMMLERDAPFLVWCYLAAMIGTGTQWYVSTVLLASGSFPRAPHAMLAVLLVGWGAPTLLRRVRAMKILELIPLAAVTAWIFTRVRPVNFLYLTGDMGWYVNAANAAARTGEFPRGSFPPGFTVHLSLASRTLGPESTALPIGVLSATMILGIAVLALLIATTSLGMSGNDVRTQLALAAGVLVAAAVPYGSWMSAFPTAELFALNFLVVSSLSVLLAQKSNRGLSLTIAGLALGPLILARGDAVLYAAPLLLLIAWKGLRLKMLQPVRLAVVVALASWSALWYSSERYMVGQFRNFLGSERAAELAQLARPASVVLVAALALTVIELAGRLRLGDVRITSCPRLALRLGAAGVLLLLVLRVAQTPEPSLARWGLPVLMLAGMGGLFAAMRVSRLDALVVTLWPLALSVAVFRVPQRSTHAYLYYWDRYLLHGVFWVVLLLSFIGLLWYAAAFSMRMSAALLVGLVLIGGIQHWDETRNLHRRTLFGNAPETILAIANQSPERLVVYSGLPPGSPGWFFPNTFRSFAEPLRVSFGRRVFFEREDTHPSPDFRADSFLTAGDARAFADSACEDVLYVSASREDSPGEGPEDARLVAELDHVAFHIPQRRTSAEERWLATRFIFRLHEIDHNC